MSGGRNRFGFGAPPPEAEAPARRRGTGPMSVAVRETAASLEASAEALAETRRRNAEAARTLAAAEAEGRLLVRLPLETVHADDLPRDRLDLAGTAQSEAMDELRASLLVHGQREPVEVYAGPDGRWQLRAGWRRLTALRQLHAETGEERFATVLARIAAPAQDRTALYVAMVEENAVREDLSFAEMAHVAIAAAADPAVGEGSPEAMVGRLYAALHKMKRSYIRAFVQLLLALGPDLRFPKAVSRNLGVEVARRLREEPETVAPLRAALAAVPDAAAQEAVLARYAAGQPPAPAPRPARGGGETYAFRHGTARVTARRGEIRIRDALDFQDLPRARLEEAVAAFLAALRGRG